MKRKTWINRNIFAMGLTSFFSDFGHEMATAILPMFLVSIGGSAALLGVIEGFADASTSFMKLFSGWYSDYIGKRKPFAAVGYFLTSALATVNGIGDFTSSTVVGFLWSKISPITGFGYAAILMIMGAFFLLILRKNSKNI